MLYLPLLYYFEALLDIMEASASPCNRQMPKRKAAKPTIILLE